MKNKRIKKVALQMADEEMQKKVYSEKFNDLFNRKKYDYLLNKKNIY